MSENKETTMQEELSSADSEMKQEETQTASENAETEETQAKTEENAVNFDAEDTVSDEKENLIQQLEQELSNTKDSLLRKAAELENVRKRVQRERIQLFEDAKVSALQEFLPISEDMKRTLDASDGAEIDKSFLEGVQLVANKFEEVLKKYGVEKIDETGIPFDVNLHDALLRQPAPDEKTESNTVLQVLESGYKIGDRVIKHAKVIVSE